MNGDKIHNSSTILNPIPDLWQDPTRPLGGSKKYIPLRIPKNDPIVVLGTIWGLYFWILPGVWDIVLDLIWSLL